MSVSVELGGTNSQLLDIHGFSVKSIRAQPNQKRQVRFTRLEMDFEQLVVAHELHVNLTTAEVFLIGRVHSPLVLSPQMLVPSRSRLSTYYKRKDKEKLINAYFQGAGHPSLSIERVLGSYDRVFCVDTNTSVTGSGRRVSVTTALTVTSKKLTELMAHVTSDFEIQVVAHDPPLGNPELHGIWSMLGFLVKNHPKLLEGRLAIITDTEFGKLKAWQDRTEPFYDGHRLPDGVDIFYATADAGSEEFMPNKLMRACDSLSSAKLREILAQGA